MILFSVIVYLAVGLIIILLTRARDVIRETIPHTKSNTHPQWIGIAMLISAIYAASILLWPFFLKSWFIKPKYDSPKEKERDEAIKKLQQLLSDDSKFTDQSGNPNVNKSKE